MLTSNTTCQHFIDALASKSPTPGGGGAAAFGGTLGMALANMVGNLTLGKKKYANVEPEVKQLIEQGEMIIQSLMQLIDEDAKVFEPLAKAYSLPKETPEQAKKREITIETLCKAAAEVPMQIMQKTYEGILIHQRMAQIGTAIAISDVGCGVTFLKSALIAAHLNVLINFKFIHDKKYLEENSSRLKLILDKGCQIADETLEIVLQRM